MTCSRIEIIFFKQANLQKIPRRLPSIFSVNITLRGFAFKPLPSSLLFVGSPQDFHTSEFLPAPYSLSFTHLVSSMLQNRSTRHFVNHTPAQISLGGNSTTGRKFYVDISISFGVMGIGPFYRPAMAQEHPEDATQNLLERQDVTEIRSKKSCRIIRCDFLASLDLPLSGQLSLFPWLAAPRATS